MSINCISERFILWNCSSY